jgi:peptidoglycan hydrolase FlgJ
MFPRLLPQLSRLSPREVTHSLPPSLIVAENPIDPERAMETLPVTLPSAPSRRDQLMSKAEELEASFLAEMLAHSGLGEMQGAFGGGQGEAQFTSFLRQEQARLIVEKGGLGLAELIFNSMVEAENANA